MSTERIIYTVEPL